MYQLQQQSQTKKKKSPARQEKVIARKQTALPVPVRMDMRGIVQCKPYTVEEIMDMANKEPYNLSLNMDENASFIRLLAGIDTSDCSYQPEERVRRLLSLAQRYGSIVTERDYEKDGAEAFLFLEHLDTHPFEVRDQYGPLGSNGLLTEEALQSMMNNVQKAEWIQQLQILLPISGIEGTKKAVEAALLYVNTGYVREGIGQQYQHPECFIQSLRSVAAFIQNAYGGLSEEYQRGYWLVSTGSDRHMGGRHVLFLVNKRNPKQKAVYKPRSVAIDAALLGKDGVFNEINKLFPQEEGYNVPHLATMQIDEYSDRNNQPYGVEEFVTKKENFEENEARNYYYQMGVLAVATRYVGLSDLHRDNIMPTKDGPMVIDAEVGLFFRNDELEDALNMKENQLKQPAMSAISIRGQEDNWKKYYEDDYFKGMAAMERGMAVLIQQPAFVQMFFEKTKNLRTRIVPVPTSDLAGWYQICVVNHFNREKFCSDMVMSYGGRQSINEDILSSLRNDIQDNDFNPYFKRKDKEAVFPDPEIIPHLIFKAFCRHDIPIFELQLESGEELLYLLDGVPIGHTAVEFRYRDML